MAAWSNGRKAALHAQVDGSLTAAALVAAVEGPGVLRAKVMETYAIARSAALPQDVARHVVALALGARVAASAAWWSNGASQVVGDAAIAGTGVSAPTIAIRR